MDKKTIKDIENLGTDIEILSYLKDQLGIDEGDDILIYGRLDRKKNFYNNYFYTIQDVRLFENGKTIQYPISDLKNTEINAYVGDEKTIDRLLFYDGKAQAAMVSSKLVLSPKSVREDRNNPLVLMADTKTIRMLEELPYVSVLQNEDGSILVEKSVVGHYKNKNSKEIEEDARNKEAEIVNNQKALQERIKEDEINLADVQSEIGVEKKTHQSILNEIERDREFNGALKNEVLANQQVLGDIQREEEALRRRMDRLNDYLKKKADSLLSLDFINEDQHKEIFGESSTKRNDDSLYVDFKKDLESDFVKAVEHIQSYLVDRDIMYPQYVLSDFFSLIQTNDLIVLAGDSGSGKTNLVKSFADAVGGVAKIIPVKPSWTSAEDLLGYYNPLQKKYLRTPFLDAIIEASRNSEVPYFICLDEMNLARVEYYFSDFLSLLEERDRIPKIPLYPDDESEHVLSELRTVISTIESLRDKNSPEKLNSFYDILKDEEVNIELKRVFGIGDKISLVSYHSTLRRLLGGVLEIPSAILFPSNVRIIGAINIDETTHYLSPKVLDRAHVIKFDNPLLSDWDSIHKEVTESGIEKKDHKIQFSIEDFLERTPYPKFDKDNEFCQKIIDITKEYLNPLDVEIGLRTIRQGLNYHDTSAVFECGEYLTMNNFLLHKVFPKFTFDGNAKVNGELKLDILVRFKEKISTLIPEDISPIVGRSAITELQAMIEKSESNDGIVNYWS